MSQNWCQIFVRFFCELLGTPETYSDWLRIIVIKFNNIIGKILNSTIFWISGFGVEFSPSFAQDGFCVSNKDGPVLMQSHALCFYEDTIFAILVWVLVNIIAKHMIPETDIALMTRYEFIRWFHEFSVKKESPNLSRNGFFWNYSYVLLI